ncbi:hypothetical protein LV84_03666 [Algoriphagus ratkowskyi]|uniref:TerB family tellurite resistance protein n=1 Tax=Algoriphagus ratkowskyi TaxID=57028 RepID=A0A2W7RBN0_9BACT|nr:hypothetical protein [Algoriphagus ratkowskyi]PZX51509.1 hypothetical protein LV84_03666 [Algoriphagus ratkowskyi]TXD78792.1 hypothetical protein ESW18_04525 [Algoriphagus ratkowskyi]
MKKLIILLYLITTALPLSAQNFEEWFNQKETKKRYLTEQIAALQAYGTVIKKGYEVTQQGLGMIQMIKTGDFSQHEDHFLSFLTINPQVKSHSDTRQIIALASRIQQLSTQTQQQLKSSKQLSQSEEAVVAHIFSNIKINSAALLHEAQLLLQNDALSFSDSQRIQRLKQLQIQMQEIHGFTVRMGQEFLQLAMQREQEFLEITQSRRYHNLD